MSAFRSRIIRLAAARPDLRSHLLLVLADDVSSPATQGTMHVTIGKEVVKAKIRKKLDAKTSQGVVDMSKVAASIVDAYLAALAAQFQSLGVTIVAYAKADPAAADLVCSKFGTAVIAKGELHVQLPISSRDPSLWKAALAAGHAVNVTVK